MPNRCLFRTTAPMPALRCAGGLLVATLLLCAGCTRPAAPPPDSGAPTEVGGPPLPPQRGNAPQPVPPPASDGNAPAPPTSAPPRPHATAKPIFPTGEPETRDTMLCQENLKHLGMAMLMYAQDYEERLPPADRWGTALRPYVRDEKFFHCPDAPGGRYGYAFHRQLGGKRISEIWQPESVVMLFETKRRGADVADNGESWVGARHGNFGHVVYLDGRVATSPTRPDFRLRR